MKIALVVGQLDPQRGGAEQWAFQFARRLLADGHEVHMVAGGFSAEAAALPLVRHVVRPQSVGRWHAPWAFATAADAMLQRLSVDVVHDLGYGWRCDVFQPHWGTRQGALRQNLRRTPTAWRWLRRASAVISPRQRMLSRLERRQMHAGGVRRFLALSQMIRREMLRYHGVADEQIRVVYNGVDVERFSPVHRSRWREGMRAQWGLGGDVVFLLVAHNFRLKGLGVLIRALGRLVQEGHAVRLLVVGKGSSGPYRWLASHEGCAERVHFVGPIPDTVPCYAAADVYVHPTYYDPCSLVVLEALASGLPAVTTVHNGAAELLTASREGFVLKDAGSVEELAAAMRSLLDRERRGRMGEAARELALAHSLERNYREIVELYREVIEEKSQRPGLRVRARVRAFSGDCR